MGAKHINFIIFQSLFHFLKQIILATHQLAALAYADHVILLGEGRMIFNGTVDAYCNEYGVDIPQRELIAVSSAGGELIAINEVQSLHTKEVVGSGAISWNTYTEYARKAGRVSHCIFLLFGLFLAHGIGSLADWWVSYWTERMHATIGEDVGTFCNDNLIT